MPAYDFKCTECELVFEETRSAGDFAPGPCPTCGAVTKRVFTPLGVVFKGTGFHNTDYRQKPAKENAPESCASKKKDSPACATCPAAD